MTELDSTDSHLSKSRNVADAYSSATCPHPDSSKPFTKFRKSDIKMVHQGRRKTRKSTFTNIETTSQRIKITKHE